MALLEKARRLTLAERKELASKNIYLLSLTNENTEQATLIIMDMLYSEKEQAQFKDYDEEEAIIVKVMQLTFGLEETDLKNS